jgi:CHASE1-domain containing sensor protein
MSRPENEAVGSDMETGRRGIWQAWALLLIGLMATAVAVHSTKTDADEDAKREFDFVCNEIQTKISDRLRAHEQILRSAAAFLDRSNVVSRQEWHRFTERQKVERQLPGIQGIGFALLIPPQKLEQHVQQIRAEGFPTYQVRPAGDREVYSSIIYLEPFTNRNLRAFGYDMLSEPVRRAAMERARDRDVAALSGKVVLVQETEQDVQAGALMYVPVYRPGMPAETIPQRREAILGWVYSPYRMDDLMQGILGGWDLAGQKRIRLEIFDGGMESPDALLYDSQPAKGQKKPSELPLAMQSGIVYAGHQWTLHFSRTGGQALAMDYGKVWLVLFGGISTSLLLSGLFYSLLNIRFKARQMAAKLTAELKWSEEKFRALFDKNIGWDTFYKPRWFDFRRQLLSL